MQIVKEKLQHSKEDFIQDYWNRGEISAIKGRNWIQFSIQQRQLGIDSRWAE